MKILSIHADYITFQATKKAIKSAEDVEKEEKRVEDCLVIFTAVEKSDETDINAMIGKYVAEIKELAASVKAEKIVLYPYAHLSSKLASPTAAVDVLKRAQEQLKKDFTVVERAPFGWYKTFNISTKGHPMSELSRNLGLEDVEDKQAKETTKKRHVAKALALPLKKFERSDIVKNSAALLLSYVLHERYPKGAYVYGLPDDKEFYYDFYNLELSGDELASIEKNMQALVKEDLPIEQVDMSLGQAKEHFKDNRYKLEILEKYGKEVTFYKIKDYIDLSFGKHVTSTSKVQALKLTKISGVYWKNDSNSKSMQRIMGVAFATQKELEDYLQLLEQAQQRDHRTIGRALDLYSFHTVSPGSPFFHPKGTVIYLTLQNFLREQYKDWGYQEVVTPLIYDKSLWEQSGHWEHFREDMFLLDVDNREASFKPMNCPSHILIFKTKSHSYKDLPIRITDFAPLHRNELKGTLGGLTRCRKFSQDDCHVFCTKDHIKQEVSAHIKHALDVYNLFGFECSIELSTKPEKAMGDPKLWKEAEQALEAALKENKVKYKISPGEGAFYGPKIDFHLQDALGRTWQCGTEQLDFQQPERFQVTYEGKDNKKHTVVMLHRTVLGSIERFMGVLVEHYAGNFPLWLNPNQVSIATVTDKHVKFAQDIAQQLRKQGIHVDVDDKHETINKKVREAQLQKYNYMITIGDKELDKKTLAIRTREGKVTFGVKVDDFIKQLKEELDKKC